MNTNDALGTIMDLCLMHNEDSEAIVTAREFAQMAGDEQDKYLDTIDEEYRLYLLRDLEWVEEIERSRKRLSAMSDITTRRPR